MPAPSEISNASESSKQRSPEEGPIDRRSFPNREEKIALYGAFCLFLSTIEFLIPKPLPFFRLGLANLPILLVLRKESPRFILALVGLKIFGQALVNGTLFSYIFVFSTAGSLASGITMTILSFLPARYLSLIGISVMGALASNLVQILLARYFLLGEGAWLIGPPFLALGTVTGILLGAIALSLSETPILSPSPPSHREPDSERVGQNESVQIVALKDPVDDPIPNSKFPHDFNQFLLHSVSPSTLFLAGVLSLPPFLFTESLLAKGVLTAFYFLCVALSGKRIKLLPNLIAFLGITATNLVTPLGQVLFYFGTFPVTLGALRVGAFKALSLLGMIALSRFTLRYSVPMPGRLGAVLARMFFYFERITERKVRLRRAHIWEDVQTLVQEVSQEKVDHSPHTVRPSHTTLAGYLFLFLFLTISWVALVY
ncbi:MAG: Gx transporter family protein [Spirochaetes bacterium]|nr:Gx transporter family protein [Spirochaetota bacterium]